MESASVAFRNRCGWGAMPKHHDRIYYAIIWRQNWLAMKWIDQNQVTIEQGLYRGAVQLLHHAIRYRNYRFARRLLQRGVDVDCRDGLGNTALQDAAQRGHLGGIKWLIRNGADYENQKQDLLLAAVRCNHPDLVRWLLQQGCDVNGIGSDGQTPIQHCFDYCDHQHREPMAELLLALGSNPSVAPSDDDAT